MNPSTKAAAIRVASTADRLARLRARMGRLENGEPATAEDVRRARELASAQIRAVHTARDRLLLMQRSAVARHEDHARRLAAAGRTSDAEREWSAVRRQREALHAHLEDRFSSRAAHDPPGGKLEEPDVGTPTPTSGADEEISRLRAGLAALLRWGGTVSSDEAERREAWCRAVVRECGAAGWQGWMHAVCVVGAGMLRGGPGVAMTVTGGSGVGLVAASDARASRVHQLELVTGEGPSVTARTEDRVVVADMVSGLDSWPGLAAAGFDDNLGHVCAVPLRVGDICVGSMVLYAAPGVVLEQDDIADAMSLAAVASTALFADLDMGPADPGLDSDWSAVAVAIGFLSSGLGISTAEAEARLRARAFSSGRSLVDVSHDAVDRIGAFR